MLGKHLVMSFIEILIQIYIYHIDIILHYLKQLIAHTTIGLV